jgi:hypothetical protein
MKLKTIRSNVYMVNRLMEDVERLQTLIKQEETEPTSHQQG